MNFFKLCGDINMLWALGFAKTTFFAHIGPVFCRGKVLIGAFGDKGVSMLFVVVVNGKHPGNIYAKGAVHAVAAPGTGNSV